MKFKHLCIIIIALACTHCQENCEAPFDKSLIVKFLHTDTKKELGDSLIFRIVFGEGSAFAVDTSVRANTPLRLFLNPQVDTVSYQFVLKKPAKTYRATLRYRRTPEIRNPDCGINMQYADFEVSKRTLIDSVAIGNTNINENTTSQPNIVFYIKP